MLINDVAQVLDPVHAEGTFFQVGIYLVLPQGVKNLLNMLQVFYLSLVVDDDVILIHHYKSIGERSQDIVHHPHHSPTVQKGDPRRGMDFWRRTNTHYCRSITFEWIFL
jgi:hypothetical protein